MAKGVVPIETLIFIYLYVCICTIIFDILFVIYRKRSTANYPKDVYVFETLIWRQIGCIKQNNKIDRKIEHQFIKKLRSGNEQVAFANAIASFREKDPVSAKIFISNTISMFIYIARKCQKRPAEIKACFAHVIFSIQYKELIKEPTLTQRVYLANLSDVLLKYMTSPSVYARENAFSAILSIGWCENVVLVLKTLSGDSAYQNDKLITEDLLLFRGDMEELTAFIWKNIAAFAPTVQVGVINFMRLLTTETDFILEYLEPMYAMLTRERQNKEVKLAILRFFRKYKYDKVVDSLYALILNSDNEWELGAVAASTLEAYPSPRTTEILTKGLSNRNWYVRFNSAESLLNLKVDTDKIVEQNGDEYAKEMISYRNRIKSLKMPDDIVGD